MTIKESIETAQQKFIESKIKRTRHQSIRASAIGDICERRLFLNLTSGELANDVTPELQAIFSEGSDQEVATRRYLSELGFEIIQAGSTEQWKDFNISGSIDGIVKFGEEKFIVEIKTVSEYAWEKLHKPDDFNEGFYARYLAQINLYMLLYNYEHGVFILKRKQAKMIRIIPIDLDYSFAESLLKKAERVNEAFKKNEAPDFLKNNPVECRRCPYFGSCCAPPMDFGDAIINIEDNELEGKLKRRDELSPMASEYEKLDKEAKDRLREIPHAIVGDFEVIGKEGIRKYKAAEAREVKTWTTKIEKIAANAIMFPG
jgi:CRISPR/Cas system-associated exonuclease Cas4 (RecB family)